MDSSSTDSFMAGAPYPKFEPYHGINKTIIITKLDAPLKQNNNVTILKLSQFNP